MAGDPQQSSESAGDIAAEIERLRNEATDTKSLYRSVAGLLFFKYGITPTANRLHQLVGKGSMSTAASVLARFWQDLRKVSQLRLDHPGLPEPLQKVGAEMLVQLWGAACDQASQELAAVRSELEVQLTEAQLEAQHAKSEASAAAERSARTEAAAAQLTANLRELADSLDQLDRDRQAAGEENQRLSLALEAAQAASSEARAAFTSDLRIVRDALATAEERARSAEQRALLEIDQERQRAARVVKRHEIERDALLAKLADQEARTAAGGVRLEEARSQIASLEGALAAAQSQILAQSKAMTQILGRMDALQEAITTGPARPGRKTSGKARGKTGQPNSSRTPAAKAAR